jgi:hypothetical protein
VFITIVIAVDISAADLSGVAIADLLAAISAARVGLEICFTDKNATHHSPPARLLCAINDLKDAKTDRATTAAPKEPPPACRIQRGIIVQVPRRNPPELSIQFRDRRGVGQEVAEREAASTDFLGFPRTQKPVDYEVLIELSVLDMADSFRHVPCCSRR